MKKNILITGASGNIGSEVCKRLKGLNIDFLAGVNKKDLASTESRTVWVDYGNKLSLEKAFEGIDILFLLFPMMDTMLNYAENAIYAAKKANVKHIVRTSGAGSYSQSNFKMPRIQGQIDEVIINSGINYTITKPTNFMQNFINFYGTEIKKRHAHQSLGDGKIAWIDVRDIAYANVEILLNPDLYVNTQFTLSGPENLSFKMALDIINAEINLKVVYTEIDENQAAKNMADFGLSKFDIEMISSLNKIIKLGYAEGISDDFYKITGKSPIKFKQFAQDYKNYWN